jgi:hypothetical protein
MNYRPIPIKAHILDFKIIKALLSNPRMQVEDIAKERLKILRENHIVEFGIIRNMSSMQLTGYIEFGVMLHLEDDSAYQPVLERIYQEMQEHANQTEGIFLVFFCPNISTVDLILRRLSCFAIK